MGSLPNLDHVLERREREKEKVLARERAREREFCHDLDSWRERALSIQVRQQTQRPFAAPRRVIRTRSSGNTHHLTDEPLENLSFLRYKQPGGPIPSNPAAKSHPKSPQQRVPTSVLVPQAQQSLQHQILPALPGNYALGHHHQVLSAQSSSNNNPGQHQHHPHYYHHHNIIQPASNPISRRRESANSSIGATSVRRLLTVNRGCRHKIPVHVRAAVIKNFIFLVIGHGLISATLLPLIGLQVSNSIWFGVRQSYSSVGMVDNNNNNMGTGTATNDNINVSSLSPPEGAAAAVDEDTDMFLGPPPREIGSLLLSLSFVLTSGMCFLTGIAIKKMGHYWVVFCGYVGIALVLTCHFLPTYYTLLPGYVILGLVYGPLCISKLNLVIVMANKLSCGQHERCNAISTTPTVNPSTIGDTEEHSILFATKPACSRDENIRRLARWFHASQNFGIICGAILASLLLTCAAFHAPNSIGLSVCLGANRTPSSDQGNYAPLVANNEYYNLLSPTTTQSKKEGHQAQQRVNESQSVTMDAPPPSPPVVEALLTIGVESFDTNNHGERICGAASCPVWWVHPYAAYVPVRGPKYISSGGNVTGSDQSMLPRVHRKSSTNTRIQGTIAVYLILCVLAIGFTVAIGKFTSKKNQTSHGSHGGHQRYNSIPGLVDTMFFAAPMAYFIGTEQGYILGDFMKAFVACSLGPHMVAGALIGMGIMQLIASCTLSMLLRHTKRIVVIIAGSFFHACLLLVLSRWKPSKDDSALFYVIAAAWGVCHAVWETLLFTLMSLTHKNHMLEVLTPIHGIQYLAMGVTFGAHGFLCEYAKIIVLAILLIVSVPPYASLEIRLEAQRKATQNSNAKSVLQIPTL